MWYDRLGSKLTCENFSSVFNEVKADYETSLANVTDPLVRARVCV